MNLHAKRRTTVSVTQVVSTCCNTVASQRVGRHFGHMELFICMVTFLFSMGCHRSLTRLGNSSTSPGLGICVRSTSAGGREGGNRRRNPERHRGGGGRCEKYVVPISGIHWLTHHDTPMTPGDRFRARESLRMKRSDLWQMVDWLGFRCHKPSRFCQSCFNKGDG